MTTPMTDERLDVSGARLWLATLPDGNRAAWLRILLHEHDEIDRLRAGVEQLKAWVGDLQSGMYVNCVYCGHRYGPGETTPVSMADALKAHVEECPHHPMSALRRENERLKAKLSERGIE